MRGESYVAVTLLLCEVVGSEKHAGVCHAEEGDAEEGNTEHWEGRREEYEVEKFAEK